MRLPKTCYLRSPETAYLRLPETGYLRLPHIIGDLKANPPIFPLIPLKKSTWWNGVRTGRFPRPIKFGTNAFWRAEDIRNLILKIEQEGSVDFSSKAKNSEEA